MLFDETLHKKISKQPPKNPNLKKREFVSSLIRSTRLGLPNCEVKTYQYVLTLHPNPVYMYYTCTTMTFKQKDLS